MKDYDLKNLADLPIKIKMVVMIIPCVLLLYFAYMFDYSVSLKQIKAAKSQETDLKLQVESLISNTTEIRHELSQLPTLKTMIKEWQQKLVKPADLSDLLNDIIKLGTANQLEFSLFSPGQPVKSDDESYIKVPVNTTITGNYNQLATFFSQIANMASIVKISDFNLAKEQKGTDKNGVSLANASRLTAKIVLEIYYLADPTNTAQPKDTPNAK